MSSFRDCVIKGWLTSKQFSYSCYNEEIFVSLTQKREEQQEKASISASPAVNQNVTFNKFDNCQHWISGRWIHSYQLWAPPWKTSFSAHRFMWHMFFALLTSFIWADQNIVVDGCCLCSLERFLIPFLKSLSP